MISWTFYWALTLKDLPPDSLAKYNAVPTQNLETCMQDAKEKWLGYYATRKPEQHLYTVCFLKKSHGYLRFNVECDHMGNCSALR